MSSFATKGSSNFINSRHRIHGPEGRRREPLFATLPLFRKVRGGSGDEISGESNASCHKVPIFVLPVFPFPTEEVVRIRSIAAFRGVSEGSLRARLSLSPSSSTTVAKNDVA